MCSVASFSSRKVHTAHYFRVTGITKEGVLYFLFDTGASYTVLGVNNLFAASPDNANKALFQKCLEEELAAQGVSERKNCLRVANEVPIKTYPCVSHHVSVEGTPEVDFYFDLSLDDISAPLLGCNYTDDCAYSHSIGGRIIITGVSDQAGAAAYKGTNVLEFDKAIERYYRSIK